MVLPLLLLVACKKEPVYPDLLLGTSEAPVANLLLPANGVHEDFAYIILESNMDGDIHYVVLPQGDTAPLAEEIILGKTQPVAKHIPVKASLPDTIKLMDLTSGASYEVYAVATNDLEGKPGEMVGPLLVACPDNTPPTLVSMNPSTGSTRISVALSQIVLTFSENIQLANAGKVRIIDVFDGTTLPQLGTIVVEGHQATLNLTDSLRYLTDVAVVLDEGAFTDEAGLPQPEYALNATGDDYRLRFQVEDRVTLELFTGAYRCTMHDVYYADNDLEYQVVLKGRKEAEHYYIDVLNFYDYNQGVATLTLDAIADTLGFELQATGALFQDEEIEAHTIDNYELATPGYFPGSFAADGSVIRIWAELYTASYAVGFYEITFTRYNALTAKTQLPPMGAFKK